MPPKAVAALDVPILITGGLGFIGGHLVDELVAAGATHIRVFDNGYRAVTPTEAWPPEVVEVIDGDVRDVESLKEAMRGCKIVFHLAAQSNVMSAVNDPEYSCATNVGGTLNVLIAARNGDVRRVVFTSSREVYGDVDRLPVPEGDPLHPKNLYGASKAAAEMYCGALATEALEIAVLRLANVYGPRDQNRVIPIFVSKAVQGNPLSIYGGDQLVDFIWIETVVAALLQAGLGERIPHPLNVGSGIGTTIKQLASRILDQTSSGSKCIYFPTRSLEVNRFVSDLSLANRYLGIGCIEDPLAHLSQLIQQTQNEIAEFEY
jgi:UDP-glucose 4-epimerase